MASLLKSRRGACVDDISFTDNIFIEHIAEIVSKILNLKVSNIRPFTHLVLILNI